jgi:L-threonylcarbamoyladenylate synthase
VILPYRTPEEIDAAIPRAVEHLRAGRLLAYPTETVYGLGSSPATGPLAELSKLKGRPARKPFLLLVSSRAMAEEWGLVFNAPARVLSSTFWPGPLTLVLRGGEGRLPDQLRGVEGGIAVRHTSHAGVARLIAALGTPLTSTSANRPGTPAAPGVERIAEVFAEPLAEGQLLALDGGVLGNVPPSTLVDCTVPIPLIIRDGAIPRQELRRLAGRFAP